jgi:drug/metabolite transporter (DMT)-like permease
MINSELLAVFYSLASAISWGTGDFSGGVATKRTNLYGVVIGSQALGGLFLVLIAFGVAEPWPGWLDLVYGATAGISGVLGLLALYRGLAEGRMGVVAPVAAVVTAIVPVFVGFFMEGLPASQQLLGLGVALVAVWLISGAGAQLRISTQELRLPLMAGLGFGLFFILIDRVSVGAVFWPLVAARLASVSMLAVLMRVRLQSQAWPAPKHVLLIGLAGLFDAGGNAFFALATQAGRLDIAAVLSSLYPASTVMLAWLILKERLTLPQWLGVGAALAAVVLIAW